MSVDVEARRLALGEGLALPVDAVTRTIAVVGQKGTGKTSTAVVVVEEASRAGARFAVMDPTGAWSGLRSSADGDGPGLDCVVMGGFNGDVPLDPYAGEVVARLVVEEGYSVVCDLEKMPRSEQVAFVADFAETALELCRSAVTVVIDESPRFVPQGGAAVEEEGMRCRVAVTELVMLGRRKGLGSVVISQRPSKLHKDVLEQADLLVSHRLMGNNDRKAIGGWLEEYGEDSKTWLERLPKLRRGEAVVLAPEYELGGVFQVRPKQTFDSSATPEVGASLDEAPRARTSIDLSELEAKMGHALEAAQENDPEALRRRIESLEAQIAEGGGADLAELEAAEAAIEELREERDVLRDALEAVNGDMHVLSALGERIAGVQAFIGQVIGPNPETPQGENTEAPDHDEDEDTRDAYTRELDDVTRRHAHDLDHARSRTRNDRSTTGPSHAETPETAETSGNGNGLPPLKAGAKRMAEAMLRAPRVVTRNELSTLAVVRKGGTLSDYLSALRGRGWLVETDAGVTLSPAGDRATRELLGMTRGAELEALSPADVARPHLPRLKAGARRMLEHLMTAHPHGYTRGELSRLADVSKGGTFSDYLSSLKTRGLAEERAKRVYAGSVLYLWED